MSKIERKKKLVGKDFISHTLKHRFISSSIKLKNYEYYSFIHW